MVFAIWRGGRVIPCSTMSDQRFGRSGTRVPFLKKETVLGRANRTSLEKGATVAGPAAFI